MYPFLHFSSATLFYSLKSAKSVRVMCLQVKPLCKAIGIALWWMCHTHTLSSFTAVTLLTETALGLSHSCCTLYTRSWTCWLGVSISTSAVMKETHITSVPSDCVLSLAGLDMTKGMAQCDSHYWKNRHKCDLNPPQLMDNFLLFYCVCMRLLIPCHLINLSGPCEASFIAETYLNLAKFVF